MSFDRVAAVYDETRGLPDEILERIVDRVIAATGATATTRFLEVGVGTGRIALPFVERGYYYTGIDLSLQMMARLREKLGSQRHNLKLAEADITALPFADGSFDVTLAVHVLHLVPEWRRALDEIERVTAPAGFFVLGGDFSLDVEQPAQAIRAQWLALVDDEGGTPSPRYGKWQDLEAEMASRDYRMAEYLVARWSFRFRPADLVERLRARTYSQTWDVSDDVLERVHVRLLAWGKSEYGDLDQEVASEMEFRLLVSRFVQI